MTREQWETADRAVRRGYRQGSNGNWHEPNGCYVSPASIGIPASTSGDYCLNRRYSALIWEGMLIVGGKKLGENPLLDKMAVYKLGLTKRSEEEDFNEIFELVEMLPDINWRDGKGMTYLYFAVCIIN